VWPSSRRSSQGAAVALALAVAAGSAADLRPAHGARVHDVAVAAACAGAAAPQERPAWRTGIDLVTVFATVTDAHGRPVTGLGPADFRVFEDGVEQRIAQFVHERVPVSLGLLVDVSDSMRGTRMLEARRALDRFLAELLDPEDEAFVMAFNHAPRIVAGWTRNPARLAGRLEAVVPSGGTAIYDALFSAVSQLERRSHQRAALVVISDGADTASDRTLAEVRSAVRRSDAFVYALAIRGDRERPSTAVKPELLRAVTDESGGYTAIIAGAAELGAETGRIAEELNHQYLLAYPAPRPPDGRYHGIRVRVEREGLTVRARRGYVADRR
jgi:Ca-activated chloride channel family protein